MLGRERSTQAIRAGSRRELRLDRRSIRATIAYRSRARPTAAGLIWFRIVSRMAGGRWSAFGLGSCGIALDIRNENQKPFVHDRGREEGKGFFLRDLFDQTARIGRSRFQCHDNRRSRNGIVVGKGSNRARDGRSFRKTRQPWPAIQKRSQAIRRHEAFASGSFSIVRHRSRAGRLHGGDDLTVGRQIAKPGNAQWRHGRGAEFG